MFALARIRTAGSVLLPALRSSGNVITPARTSADMTGWWYRTVRKDVPKSSKIASEVLMGVMWYWVLFHCWYDSGHLFGHFPYPDPSKWTDAELGIPPDSED